MSQNNLVRHLLSERETEILNLIVYKELNVEEIADNLFITVRTVRFFLEQIRKRYDCESTSIAVIRYMKELEEWQIEKPTQN